MRRPAATLIPIFGASLSLLFLWQSPSVVQSEVESHAELRTGASTGLEAQESASGALGGVWYFAVSGDSRDCGNLIMPLIARSIEGLRPAINVAFYWHLGDFRRMTDIDCDMLRTEHPDSDCLNRHYGDLGSAEMDDYLNAAWNDFIEHQVKPFGETCVKTPFFLGIGNHELDASRTRDDFRRTFQKWLVQEPVHAQRMADLDRKLNSREGETYYHFVHKNVDFIFLDNADDAMFDAPQIVWLTKVLNLAIDDSSINAIVVGMHKALPYSTARSHAMDASCQGLCSGQQVYDLLYHAQNQPRSTKKVYVLASHHHAYSHDVFNTTEHHGQVLPGWVIGTAGAQQYSDDHRNCSLNYGYVLVEVRMDGTLDVQFKSVTETSLPTAPSALADYCFHHNCHAGRDDSFKGDCPCGSTR